MASGLSQWVWQRWRLSMSPSAWTPKHGYSAAAATAKSLQSCPVRPHRQQPSRLPRPWDSPGKNTGVGCHFLLQCMKVKRESEVSQSCPALGDPMDCSLPGSSIHGIFQARVLEWGAIAFSNPFLLGIKFQTNQKTWIKKKFLKPFSNQKLKDGKV